VPVHSDRSGPGDFERIDFKFMKADFRVALEVKWAKSSKVKLDKEVRKLKSTNADQLYVLIFGVGATINKLRVTANNTELNMHGKLVEWNAGKTYYAARWLRI